MYILNTITLLQTFCAQNFGMFTAGMFFIVSKLFLPLPSHIRGSNLLYLFVWWSPSQEASLFFYYLLAGWILNPAFNLSCHILDKFSSCRWNYWCIIGFVNYWCVYCRYIYKVKEYYRRPPIWVSCYIVICTHLFEDMNTCTFVL